MRNVIQLKKAKAIEAGDYVLTPQNSMGLVFADKIARVERIADSNLIELTTEDKRLHVVRDDVLIAVVI